MTRTNPVPSFDPFGQKYATGCIDWFPNVLQLNGVAVGNQILENVLLAFKMSGNCHFQIKWLDNPEYKKMVGRIP
jgi:hypothetical protein